MQLSGGNIELTTQNLGSIEELLKSGAFFRVSRSYLVNLNAVTAVRGPKSALRLHLRGVEHPIPVSRGFAGELEARLDATE